MNNNDRGESIFSPLEGFSLGNLFPELYTPYKNYKPKEVRPLDEKGRMLLDIDKISFARHEINLYLDLHPDDQSMLKLFNDYREKENECYDCLICLTNKKANLVLFHSLCCCLIHLNKVNERK